MKIRSMNIWSAVLATTIVGCWATASNAAEDRNSEQPSNNVILVPAAPPVPTAPNAPQLQRLEKMEQLQGRVGIVAKTLTAARPRTNLAGSIRTAAEAVRDAKGDDAKAAAQKNLAELLGKSFDEDTQRRQEELTQIEERLAKLRELLERRRSKKQDILELQMKVALNEADGLGFYDSEHPGGPKGVNTFIHTTIDGSPVVTWGNSEESRYRAPMTYNSGASVAEPKPEPKKSKSESKSSIQSK